METNKKKFIDIIKEALELEYAELSDYLNNYDTWDSIGRLSLIALIDEHFDIQISDEEFEKFETVNDIYENLQNKL